MRIITRYRSRMRHWKQQQELSDRYVNDRFLPDKAIDLMDEAAARTESWDSIGSQNRQALRIRSRSCRMQERHLDQALMDGRSGESPQSCKEEVERLETDACWRKREPAAGVRVPTYVTEEQIAVSGGQMDQDPGAAAGRGRVPEASASGDRHFIRESSDRMKRCRRLQRL